MEAIRLQLIVLLAFCVSDLKKLTCSYHTLLISAATLIALGADEIIMHPFSNLGPVDPQLIHKRQNQENIHFGSEDLRNYIEFLKNDVGLSDQAQMLKAFELVAKEIGAIPIGVAKRSAQLALSMGEKLLALHMKDPNKARTIAETLNKSYYHHGYPLGRTEAREIGLSVSNPPAELEQAMWFVFESFEIEMKLNEAFDPVKVIIQEGDATGILTPAPLIQIPGNLPPDLLQQVYQSVLQQIQVINPQPVDYELFQAALESEFLQCAFQTRGKILAKKGHDGSIAINTIPTYEGWNFQI